MSENLNKYLSQNKIPGIEKQPKKVQEATKNNIDKILKGEIEFYSYRGDPMIYSHLDQSWFDIKGEVYRDCGHTISYEDRLEPMSLEEFNQKFNNYGDYLKSKFFLISQLKNLKVYISNPEIFLVDILELFAQKFSHEDNVNIKMMLNDTLGLMYTDKYSKEINMDFHIIFMVYKMLENGVDYDDICDFIENCNCVDPYHKNYKKTGYYKNYELISNIFELVNAYYIYFSSERNKFGNINSMLKNVSNKKCEQEILSLLSIIDFQAKFRK